MRAPFSRRGQRPTSGAKALDDAARRRPRRGKDCETRVHSIDSQGGSHFRAEVQDHRGDDEGRFCGLRGPRVVDVEMYHRTL